MSQTSSFDGALVRWPDLGQMRAYDALRGLHARVAQLAQQTGDERLRPLLVVGAPQPPAAFDGPDLAAAAGYLRSTLGVPAGAAA